MSVSLYLGSFLYDTVSLTYQNAKALVEAHKIMEITSISNILWDI